MGCILEDAGWMSGFPEHEDQEDAATHLAQAQSPPEGIWHPAELPRDHSSGAVAAIAISSTWTVNAPAWICSEGPHSMPTSCPPPGQLAPKTVASDVSVNFPA